MNRILEHSAVFLALAFGLMACADDAKWQSQQELWERSKPMRYVVQTCTLAEVPPGCVRAVIEDGVVVEAEERIYAAGIDWEPIEIQRDPLDEMFEQVRMGDTEECRLENVTYDRSFGFVDWYDLTCDEGVRGGRWVIYFEPDTDVLARCDVWPDE